MLRVRIVRRYGCEANGVLSTRAQSHPLIDSRGRARERKRERERERGTAGPRAHACGAPVESREDDYLDGEQKTSRASGHPVITNAMIAKRRAGRKKAERQRERERERERGRRKKKKGYRKGRKEETQLARRDLPAISRLLRGPRSYAGALAKSRSFV